MATQITINSVFWGNLPAAGQTCTFQYKKFSDAGWTLISNSSTIAPNGNLTVPLTVPGLTPGTAYYLQWTNNCDSPVHPFIIGFNT